MDGDYSHEIKRNLLLRRKEVKVQVTQLWPTFCDPMAYIVHGILQARILEWVAFPFSGDLPNPGIEPRSPALQADSLPAEPQGNTPRPPFPAMYKTGLKSWLTPKLHI